MEVNNYKSPWTEKEKQLTADCRNIGELFERYYKEIGTPEKGNRITSLWSHKKAIRAELAIKKQMEKQAGITSIVTRQDSLPDMGEILVGISNKLSELNSIQKDMLELFKTMKKPEEKNG